MSDDSSKKPHTIEPLLGAKHKQWGIPGALFFGVIAYLLPDLILLAIAPVVVLLGGTENERQFLLIAVYELLVIGIVGLVVAAYGKTTASVGLGAFKLEFIWKALVAFVLYMPLSIIVSLLVSSVLPYNQEQEQPLGFANPAGYELILIFIGLVILVPLAEEVLFRGFIFSGLRKQLSFLWTSILVSILFALVHGQVNVGLDVFALSLVLCYLREKTDSLWPAILLHATKNGVAFAALAASGFTG